MCRFTKIMLLILLLSVSVVSFISCETANRVDDQSNLNEFDDSNDKIESDASSGNHDQNQDPNLNQNSNQNQIQVLICRHEKTNQERENFTTADCYRNGSYELVEYCDACGKEISRTYHILESSHNMQPVYTDGVPCPERGLIVEACIRCGYEVTTENEWQHNLKTTSIPATCIENGIYSEECINLGCNYSRKRTTTAKGHNFVDGVCENCGRESYSKGLEYSYFSDYCIVVGIGECKDKDIIIPSTHNGYPVIGIGYGAFLGEEITDVQISDGIKWIGQSAFELCTKLRTISFSQSVEILYANAFRGCESLKEIEIPEGITDIGLGVFANCTSLECIKYNAINANEISILTCPDMIGFFANSGTESKGITVVIGKNVKQIPDYLFSSVYDPWINSSYSYASPNIIEVLYERDRVLEKIGDFSFYNCDTLVDMYIPATVTEIGEAAFEECSNLSSIIFQSEGLLEILKFRAFYNCSNLERVTFDTYYGSDDGYYISLLNFNTIETSAFQYCKSLKELTISASVTHIGDSAFYECTDLERVIFRDDSQIESIGDHAFYDCVNLSKIDFGINSQLESIGIYAFGNCKNLKSILIPKSTKIINLGAFKNCINLSSVTFESTSMLEKIGSGAFYCCINLKKITIRGVNLGFIY